MSELHENTTKEDETYPRFHLVLATLGSLRQELKRRVDDEEVRTDTVIACYDDDRRAITLSGLDVKPLETAVRDNLSILRAMPIVQRQFTTLNNCIAKFAGITILPTPETPFADLDTSEFRELVRVVKDTESIVILMTKVHSACLWGFDTDYQGDCRDLIRSASQLSDDLHKKIGTDYLSYPYQLKIYISRWSYLWATQINHDYVCIPVVQQWIASMKALRSTIQDLQNQ